MAIDFNTARRFSDFTENELADLPDFAKVDSFQPEAQIVDAPGGAAEDSPAGEEHRRRRLTLLESFGLPSPDWIIKGLLPCRGIGQIYGPSYSGKSLLAVSLALAVSAGKPWFGFQTRKTPVCYLAIEDSAGVIDMLRALRAYHNLTDGDLAACDMRLDIDPFRFGDLDYLEDVKRGLPQGCLLIVDTQAASAIGLDENSAKDMSYVLDGATAIAGSCSGFCLMVHHCGKDSTRGARGSYSQFAADYLAIEVKADNDSRTWSAVKVKGSRPQGPFHYTIGSVLLGLDADGDPVTAAIALPDSDAEAKASAERQALQGKGSKKLSKGVSYGLDCFKKVLGPFDAIHLEVWRREFYRSSTADTTNAKNSAFRRARRELVELGLLEVADDLYSLSNHMRPLQNDIPLQK